MINVKRFGVSIEKKLLDKFDKYIKLKKYDNRSKAIRDLIREKLVSEEWKTKNVETMGVFSLVYNHHKSSLSEKLNEIQHHNLNIIVSTTHVHIDHNNCLEVIILKGKSNEIQDITNSLQSIDGVKHGKLIMTTTGSKI